MVDRSKDPDIVFTDPEMEVELIDGSKHSYPKYIGMKKEAKVNKMLFDFLESIGVEDSFDALNVYALKSNIIKNADEEKMIDTLQEVVGNLVCKDNKWVDKNLYIEDMVSVISLFLSETSKRMKRMGKTHDAILKILGIPTSTELPAESSDGQSKKPTELPKKKS